jgi:hypothetical protein
MEITVINEFTPFVSYGSTEQIFTELKILQFYCI